MIETTRLMLREYLLDDLDAVHSYGSSVENTMYMQFGPNSIEESQAYLDKAINEARNGFVDSYRLAIELKKTNKVIGGCDIHVYENEAEIGWVIHRDYWKQGYGTEMGAALLRFAFVDLDLHRIIARCDTLNVGSYRLMEKIGMRREALLIEGRPANKMSDKKYGDEYRYAIIKDEWEAHRDIEYYNTQPFEFNDFMELPDLSDDVVHLVCVEKKTGVPDKKLVPSYNFAICISSEKVGEINLRIGYSDRLYYGGNIGYCVLEKYRAKGYATRACKLLVPVAKWHGMEKLLITCDHENAPSRRVCEKLGASLIRCARLPEWHDIYKEGGRFEYIHEWAI